MDFFKKLFRKKLSPMDQFANDVVTEFEKHNVTPIQYDPAEFILRLPALGDLKNIEIGLRNIFLHTLNAPTKRTALIQSLVRGIVSTPVGFNSLDDISSSLMPLVRSRGINTIEGLQLAVKAIKQPAATYPGRPFLDDLVAMIGIDCPDQIHRLSDDALKKINSSFDETMAMAMQNLRKKVDAAKFPIEKTDTPGVYYSSSAEDYQTSLLLLSPHASLELPALDGDPVVMCPSRNQMLITGSRNETGLTFLIQHALRNLGATGHWCSARIYIWRNEQWTAFDPPVEDPVRKIYEKTLVNERAYFQSAIKTALQRQFEAAGQDVYVGAPVVFEKDGRTLTSTTWTKQVTHGVIPETDWVSFIDLHMDPATGKASQEPTHLTVSWKIAFSTVGYRLTQLPDVWPCFFEFRSFPDQAELASLKLSSIF